MMSECHYLISKECWLFKARITFILLILTAFAFTTLAQDIKVSGTVRDQNGEGLPGATVLIKGTNIGTAADVNGYYSLNTTSNAILSVSFIGFQTIELPPYTQNPGY